MSPLGVTKLVMELEHRSFQGRLRELHLSVQPGKEKAWETFSLPIATKLGDTEKTEPDSY